ncbi:MAG: hypothetical protein KIG36_07350 [Eubacteriales bacterium]|nr:hypothetical protein [Eubacteriales bacterium]
MTDRTSVIFGNAIDKKTVKAAEKSKAKYIKKYGDDSDKDYKLAFEPIGTLSHMDVRNIVFGENDMPLEGKPLIVGNIRMGFGHYRISIAMASCARALGFTPYWLDLASFAATGSDMIREQNAMYSMASRISQKSRLFNHFLWEPLNSEGFKKITYNAKDQKNSELLVPIFRHIDKDIPYIATHVWPSQGAVHAGMTHVVNAIPDNWPMGLHLSEGAIHTVQTPFAYLGYKTLEGFAKTPLRGIPDDQLKMVGCYVDHELLADLKEDNRLRRERVASGGPVRILMNVGGAGAGGDMFKAMIDHLLPYIDCGEAALYLNTGDHADVFDRIAGQLAGRSDVRLLKNDYEALKGHVSEIRRGEAHGICLICDNDIFRAVYSTNLLMPVCDLMVTKPSELVYYPIPKLFMKHIGGHEVYGAIHGREFGDSTNEYPTKKGVCAALDRLLSDREIILHLCDRIDELKAQGYYDGAYECVRLAAGLKE